MVHLLQANVCDKLLLEIHQQLDPGDEEYHHGMVFYFEMCYGPLVLGGKDSYKTPGRN